MATIYKRGPSWYLQYTTPDGKRSQESLGKISQVEAKVALNAKEIELTTGENPLLPSSSLTLVDVIPEILEWYKIHHPASYERAKIYQNHLLPYFGQILLTEISLPQIHAYQHARMDLVKITTINKEIRHLNGILNRCVEWELILKNPLSNKKFLLPEVEDKPPRYFTKQELQLIYAAHPKSAPYWQILAGTGLRRKEAMNLTWNDVQEDTIHVISTQQRRNKTAKWRQIPLSQNVKANINQIKKMSTFDTNAHVFPQIDPRNFSRKFERILQKLNIQDASLHTLRHTFCSHLAMNGVPLRTIQVLAGHSSFRTTERYAHLAPQHLKDAVANLNL